MTKMRSANRIADNGVLAVVVAIVLVACADQPEVAPGPTSALAPLAAPPVAGSATAPAERQQAPTPTLLPPTPTPETTTATFTEGECPFQLGERAVTCGYLTVPENRRAAGGRQLQLAVAIVHATGNTPESDPIVFLHGGPGAQAVASTPWVANNLGEALVNRDLIVFDQRGMGLSQPSLDCPEVAAAVYPLLGQVQPPEVRREAAEAAHTACYRRLVATGIDLTQYNSAESAADINDLRLALGHDQVNLYGVSYGSRLALTAMRDYPHAVRSAILDSTVPLEVDMFATLHTHRARAFSLLFSHCAADARCAVAFPDLENRFYALVDKLDAEPLTVQLRYQGDSQLYDVAVDGDSLINILHWALYSGETIPYLPRYIAELESGIVTNWLDLIYAYAFIADGYSEGASAAVMCREEYGLSNMVLVTDTLHPRLQAAAASFLAAEADQCAIWQVAPAPALENEPVRSAIPTLILAGEFDPITPPYWGEQVAATLGTAYYYAFPGASHGVLSEQACAREMVAVFLDAPAQEPALDCFAQQQETTFFSR